MEQNLLFGHYRLLHHMKRVQRTADDLVAVEFFSTTLCTARVSEGQRNAVKLRGKWRHELRSCLDSLVEKDCLVDLGEEDSCQIYQIKYDTRRAFQSSLARFGRFLLTSVVVPIVVSIVVSAATTLVTAWLSGLLAS